MKCSLRSILFIDDINSERGLSMYCLHCGIVYCLIAAHKFEKFQIYIFFVGKERSKNKKNQKWWTIYIINKSQIVTNLPAIHKDDTVCIQIGSVWVSLYYSRCHQTGFFMGKGRFDMCNRERIFKRRWLKY